MKPCPYCAEEIQDAAVVCKHCGRDLVATAPPPPAPAAPAKVSTGKGLGMGCLVVIAIGFAAIVLLTLFGPTPTPAPAHDDVRAFLICQQFVEKRLRAPGSAKFPASNEAQIQSIAETEYRVRSHVDAQNAFGALIRNAFDCTVEYQPASKNWRLKNLSMDGQ